MIPDLIRAILVLGCLLTQASGRTFGERRQEWSRAAARRRAASRRRWIEMRRGLAILPAASPAAHPGP